MLKKIALASLIIILALVNWSIFEKEKHLAKGRTVYLELVPVDPRSLMQGDYMALRFDLAEKVYGALPRSEKQKKWRHDIAASDGFTVVTLNEQGIGIFKDLYTNQALAKNEILMRYRVRNGGVKFATNAFFFQEGFGKYYEPARYGQFKVDKKGELLLVAMHDKDLKKLVSPAD